MSAAAQYLESGGRPVGELTPDDVELLRYLLDLSLQPLDSFDGFSHIEQYLLSALRYQLNYTCYALALAQYSYTPAFTGYLAQAQANTIEKMRDKRVWGYWAHECLIGYQRWNPDPIVFANVMYTGFFGVMLGVFETLNDRCFSEPGALTLQWNDDTQYRYEFASLCESIHQVGHRVRQLVVAELLGSGHHRGNAGHVLARLTTKDAAGEVPEAWRTGPILAQAAYPEVLVTRAVTDGQALDLVLRPGNGGGRTVLGMERLAPRRDYVVTGAVDETVTADDDGCALVTVELDDRREVLLRPAAP